MHILQWRTGETHSNVLLIGGGAFGTLLVPAALDGASLQVHTELESNIGGLDLTAELSNPADFTDVALLSSAKVLATGANAFSSDELTQVGAAGPVRFVLGAAPAQDVQAVLLWKD
jgi:hypothetical protein